MNMLWNCGMEKQHWLVVSTPPKNLKDNWDDHSQDMEKQKMFQTTNQNSIVFTFLSKNGEDAPDKNKDKPWKFWCYIPYFGTYPHQPCQGLNGSFHRDIVPIRLHGRYKQEYELVCPKMKWVKTIPKMTGWIPNSNKKTLCGPSWYPMFRSMAILGNIKQKSCGSCNPISEARGLVLVCVCVYANLHMNVYV